MLGTLFGGNKTKTVADAVNKICAEVTQSFVSKCIMAATQEQLIEVKNISGDFILDGASFEQGASVDMTCVMATSVQADIQANIAQKIAQFAKTEGLAGLSGLSNSAAEIETIIKNEFGLKINQETLQESVMQTLQRQKISAENVGGNVVLSNISMNQSVKMVASAILSSSGYSSVIADVITDLKAAASSKETDPFANLISAMKAMATTWMLVILGVVIIVGIVLFVFIRYVFTTDTGSKLIDMGADVAKTAVAIAV